MLMNPELITEPTFLSFLIINITLIGVNVILRGFVEGSHKVGQTNVATFANCLSILIVLAIFVSNTLIATFAYQNDSIWLGIVGTAIALFTVKPGDRTY